MHFDGQGLVGEKTSSSFCVHFHVNMDWTGSHNGFSPQSTVLGKFRIEFHFSKVVAY